MELFDLDFSAQLTIRIVCFAVIVDSLETLSRKKLYFTKELLSYRLIFYKEPSPFQALVFIQYFIPLIFTKLILASFLIFTPGQYPLLLLLVLIIQVISYIRHKSGNSAADQMIIIVLTGMSIYSFNFSQSVNSLSVYFVAFQSIISYVTAGYHKLVSSIWRSGEAVKLVMGTESYGHIGFYNFLAQNKGVSLFLSWSTILFDFTFFVALLHPNLAIIYSFFGLLFHFANSYFMGLNMFMYVFPSTFPCIVYTSFVINKFLF